MNLFIYLLINRKYNKFFFKWDCYTQLTATAADNIIINMYIIFTKNYIIILLKIILHNIYFWVKSLYGEKISFYI